MSRELKPGIIEVGTRDYDRELFDELIPLPDGTSYNSYIVQGTNKTALIDTVDPTKTEKFLENIKGIHIDYIVANHAEQDHSGSIPKVLEIFPEVKIVCNEKCKEQIQILLHIPDEKFQIINDGDKLDLGYKNLRFIFTPWVHWPETMCTFLEEDKILFTCDFFGAHLAEEELFVQDETKVIDSALRYYAEIMMPFRKIIQKNLEKLDFEIDMIAPSHGQVYNKPSLIVDFYKEWVSDETKKQVVIPYISMHESTEFIIQYLSEKLTEKGIEVIKANLTHTSLGDLAISIVSARGLVVGTPAFLGGVHPQVANMLYLANALKPKLKFFSVVGSYGWGCHVGDEVQKMLPHLQAEYLPALMIKGLPDKEGLKEIDSFAEEIIKKCA